MNRLVIGVLLAMAGALGIVTWLWLEKAEQVGELETLNRSMGETIIAQEDALKNERAKFALLDASLNRLADTTAAINASLGKTQQLIANLPRSEGDTDASINCLDVAIPRAASDLLRKPTDR